jgi:uncharacterized membrane protein YgdD (TMEM256/DUF423 family)
MLLEPNPALERRFLLIGACSGFLAVALGAFGAHGLRDALSPDRLDVFETAVRYQMFHALALIATGLLATRRRGRTAPAAGWLFVLGTVLFSGSLYVLALTGGRAWGAITPFGGVAWLLGWVLLAAASVRPRTYVTEIDEEVIEIRAGDTAETSDRR